MFHGYMLFLCECLSMKRLCNMLNSCCAILVNSLLLRSTPKYRADGTSVGTAVKCESGATMNEETLQEVAEEKATEPPRNDVPSADGALQSEEPTAAWLTDPRVFAVNRLPGHTDHNCADDQSGALKQHLDGAWAVKVVPSHWIGSPRRAWMSIGSTPTFRRHSHRAASPMATSPVCRCRGVWRCRGSCVRNM